MAVYKNCKTCGAEFKVSKDRRFYCCEACKKRHKKKKIDVKSNYDSIADIVRKATKLGMSYGDYVARFGV